MDVGGHDPQLLALLQHSIQLLTVTNTVRIFVVQEDRWPVVGADLVEGVPSEIFVAHNLLIGKFVKCPPHPFEIPLELLFRRLPATLKQVLAVIGIDRSCRRELTSSRLPRDGRVLLIKTDVVVEDGAGVWIRADQAVEHRLSGG